MNDIQRYRAYARKAAQEARKHKFFAENMEHPNDIIRHTRDCVAALNEHKAHMWAMRKAIWQEAVVLRARRMIEEIS